MNKRSQLQMYKPLAMAVLTGFVISGLSLAAEFSADFIDTKMGRPVTGKVYVKGDKVRREEVQGTQKAIKIFRMDKEVIWMLNPEQKTYTEMEGFGKDLSNVSVNDPRVKEMLSKLGEYKLMGTETVNAYLCDKYALVYHDKSFGTQYQWVAKKLNVPVKIEQKSPQFSMLIEYKNIKEEPIPDSLFEVPAGYRKLSFPGIPGLGKIPGMSKPSKQGQAPDSSDAEGEPEYAVAGRCLIANCVWT